VVSSTGVSSKAYPIFSRIKGWKEVLKMLSSLKNYSLSEVAKKKMEIIDFYNEFGEKATVKVLEQIEKL